MVNLGFFFHQESIEVLVLLMRGAEYIQKRVQWLRTRSVICILIENIVQTVAVIVICRWQIASGIKRCKTWRASRFHAGFNTILHEETLPTTSNAERFQTVPQVWIGLESDAVRFSTCQEWQEEAWHLLAWCGSWWSASPKYVHSSFVVFFNLFASNFDFCFL